MSWWLPALQAGSSLIGGAMGASASRRASSEEEQAYQRALAEQRRARDETQRMFAPYQGIYNQALGIGTAPEIDYDAYVRNNPDLMAEYQRTNMRGKGRGQFYSPADYGRYHYETFGRNEGRQVPMTGGQQGGASGQDLLWEDIQNAPDGRAATAGLTNDLWSLTGNRGMRGNLLSSATGEIGERINRDYAGRAVDGYFNRLSGATSALYPVNSANQNYRQDAAGNLLGRSQSRGQGSQSSYDSWARGIGGALGAVGEYADNRGWSGGSESSATTGMAPGMAGRSSRNRNLFKFGGYDR